VDPNLRRKMNAYYRVGASVGILSLAVACGLFLGGNHSAALVGLTACTGLFVAGQIWARRRL
jgi:hypothetical protein